MYCVQNRPSFMMTIATGFFYVFRQKKGNERIQKNMLFSILHSSAIYMCTTITIWILFRLHVLTLANRFYFYGFLGEYEQKLDITWIFDKLTIQEVPKMAPP